MDLSDLKLCLLNYEIFASVYCNYVCEIFKRVALDLSPYSRCRRRVLKSISPYENPDGTFEIFIVLGNQSRGRAGRTIQMVLAFSPDTLVLPRIVNANYTAFNTDRQ
jgi:hypothetical protein